ETLTLRRHREFLAFAMAVIRRDADRPATGLSAYRGVVRAVSAYRGLHRKLGVHAALAREAGHGPAVIVDEGTIHCAHYVLVHVNSAPRPQDIAAFCRLVPMPDLVVYVTHRWRRCSNEPLPAGTRPSADEAGRRWNVSSGTPTRCSIS